MIRIVPLAALSLAASTPAAAVAAEPQRAEPTQQLPTLFSDEDYPAAAIRNHEQGAVGFRLEVGADGRPSGCVIEGSSGSAILDSTTCRLLVERARFRPARDARGRATTDRFSGRIIWRMADGPAPLHAAQSLWGACVMGEAAKLVPGDLAPDEVLRRAFPACTALEALVAREAAAPMPLEPVRASMARIIGDFVTKLRAELKAPQETATPSD